MAVCDRHVSCGATGAMLTKIGTSIIAALNIIAFNAISIVS